MKGFVCLMLCCGFAAPAGAQWKSCEELSRPLDPAVKGIVLRVPGQLSVERRKSRAEENTTLWVYLENVNPYKFAYSARAERFPADDATIQGFLELIGIPRPGAGAAAAGPCGRRQTEVDALMRLVSPLREELTKLVELLNQRGGEQKVIQPDYEKFLEDTDGEWLTPESVRSLCQRAESLAEQMSKFQAAGLSKQATALLKKIESQKGEIKKALDALTSALDKDKAEAEKKRLQIALDAKQVELLKANSAAARKLAEAARAEAKKLRAATPANESGAKAKDAEAVAKDAEAEKLEKEAAGLESGLAGKRDELAELEQSEECRKVDSAGADWINLAKDDSKALVDKAKEAVETAGKLEAAGKAFAHLFEIIKRAHTHEDPLTYRRFRFDTGSDGETDRLTLERKNLREEGTTLQRLGWVELIGLPERFSMSGGVGFSTLPERKVVRQISRGEVDNAEPVTKFDYDSKHQWIRPAVLVLLNAHLRKFNLFEKKDATFAISTGVIGSGRDDGTQIEYVVGPSLGLLRNKMFFNFGLHLGKVETLAGGFNIGGVIPSQVQDPLPTRRSWKPGFIFSISYSFYRQASNSNTANNGSTTRP